MNKPIEVLTDEGTAHITDDQFITAFNNLSKARRIRLIIEMSNRLAEDIIDAPYPGENGSAEDLAKWNRATLLRDEAGMDSTVWSEELSDEWEKQEFTNEEELAMSLWSIRRNGPRVRSSIMAKNAAKIVNTAI
jgi:hypothetical protein